MRPREKSNNHRFRIDVVFCHPLVGIRRGVRHQTRRKQCCALYQPRTCLPTATNTWESTPRGATGPARQCNVVLPRSSTSALDFGDPNTFVVKCFRCARDVRDSGISLTDDEEVWGASPLHSTAVGFGYPSDQSQKNRQLMPRTDSSSGSNRNSNGISSSSNGTSKSKITRNVGCRV